MKFVRKLPEVDKVTAQYPLPEVLREKRSRTIRQIQDILDGADRRKLLLIGPCSADREDAVVEYILKLVVLEAGAQLVGGCVYGKSITDPCLGWDKTERLVLELNEYT